MSSKKFVARKQFVKNNSYLRETISQKEEEILNSNLSKDDKKKELKKIYGKVLSLTARTSKKTYVDTSVKKLLVVADIIRGKNVDEALTILHNLPKKAARILYKFVKSAKWNAVNNAWLDASNLYIERIDLWRGMKIKRMRFASRSRIHGYVKYRSFVRVVLNSK